MRKYFEVPATIDNIVAAVKYIDDVLTKRRIPSQNKAKTLLIAEETIARMVENADEESVLIVESRSIIGNVDLRLRCKGSAFDVEDIEKHLLFDDDSDQDERMNEFVHNFVDKLFGDQLSIRNNRGTNQAYIKVVKSNYSSLISTLLALVLGILAGILIKNLTSEIFSAACVKYVFDPVFSVLMNALKMMIAPLVFCSIAASIADFSDLGALGKIAGK